ncbi:transmembrane protein 218 [Aythya fuligula]|uniref:Transmembrane protein 218 n=1 Tax=Aythya fuligula TaxID=219594 RepID=A0A6J3E1Y9_AYTFU|nr:transmembrane protein 218 [Aythya fuligula]
MAGPVLGAGPGALLLAALWALALLLCLALARAPGAASSSSPEEPSPPGLRVLPVLREGPRSSCGGWFGGKRASFTVMRHPAHVCEAPALLSDGLGRARLFFLPVLRRRALRGAWLLAFCCKPLFQGHCVGPQVDQDHNTWLFRSLQIVDTFFISRLILLAVMALVFLGCLFLLLLHHLAEPVYAKPLRRSWR